MTKKKTKTKNRQSCATLERPDCPDHRPAVSGGCRQDEKGRNHSKPGPKTQKTCPVPQESSLTSQTSLVTERGGEKGETRRNIPYPDPNTQKTSKQTDKKNPGTQNLDKRETIERSGDAKTTYPRLLLEIHLRYLGAPVQTR